MSKTPILFFFILFILIYSSCCGQDEMLLSTKNRSLFRSVLSTQSNVTFYNKITETDQFNHLVWEAIFNGGGVAIGDINNDGLPDLFFTGNQVEDALYLNKGDLQFEDISTSAGINQQTGWSTGVTFADVNADGWLDIYVCRSWWDVEESTEDNRRNLLWINNRDLTFTEQAEPYGLGDIGYSTQAAFFDSDLDGDLDVYVLNSPSHNLLQKVQYAKSQLFPFEVSDHFYKNNNGKFVQMTREMGLESYAYGLGISVLDLNFDGYPDLYIANDFEKPDRLLMNQGGKRFKDEVQQKFKHLSFYSMGTDAADINNDGYLDLAVLDMQTADHYRAKTNMKSMNATEFWRNVSRGYHHQYMSNVLQLNRGAGFFSEIGQLAGIARTDWSWSVLLADFNNDTWSDIFITNGINRDIRNNDFLLGIQANWEQGDFLKNAQKAPSNPLSNHLFQNKGDLTFEDVTATSGLGEPSFSHGAAYADLDNDGDLDLVINHTSRAASIYENLNLENHKSLRINIKGSAKNTQGLGTKALLQYDGKKQYRELATVRGFQSSSESALHFGLGDVEVVDTVYLIFPDGKMHFLKNVKTDQVLQLEYATADDRMTPLPYQAPFFTEVNPSNSISFTHQENAFNDYEREVLLPHRQSTQGPFMSVGDVNNDGLEDVFIGGASGQAGVLWLQKNNQIFQKSSTQPWQVHAAFEDMGSVLFDLENDGDLDLYVASGGSEFNHLDTLYQDRLYLNDGHGNFTNSTAQIKGIRGNASCVRAADYNEDGFTDIFIGGRGYPGKYPQAGYSYLLYNRKGKLLQMTDKLARGLQDIGMVTDATWTDFDQDGQTDLVVLGEWMQPTFFKAKGDQLKQIAGSFDSLSGWWFHISAADLDQDGDSDFILGNIGMNNKFRASQEKPLLVYGNDFDQNSTNDVVLAKLSEKGVLPVRGRECSSEQMPFIAAQFPTFDAFAKAELGDILGEERLNEATHYEAREFRSGILRNDGDHFTFLPFPNLAQIAPIMDAITMDLDRDGLKDLILAGNLFDAEVETVRYDAGNGLVLMNKGNCQFETLPTLQSGFYAPGNTKDLAKVTATNGKSLILVGVNDGAVKGFLVDEKE